MKQKGFTLLEIVIVMAAIGIMITVTAGGRRMMMQSSWAKQTAKEMSAIRDAGLAYYWKNGAFPTTFTQLSEYMSPKLVNAPVNPYGSSYTFSSSGLRFQVSTTIPKSVAGNLGLEQFNRTVGVTNDTITTSGILDIGGIGGVIYEKDHGWSG